MQRTLVAAALFGACCFAGSTAHALSCRGRLIEPGDVAARVRAYCGAPVTVRQRVVRRNRAIYYRGYYPGMVVRDSLGVAVTLEEWVYDFGPQRFMEELTFEDGQLLSMRELGYGTPSGHEVDSRAEPIRHLRALPVADRPRAMV